jgi:hypothetical protein
MIPTTFNEETEFLGDNNLNSLKYDYMTYHWKVRKDFLDKIEDSMSHGFIIGSKISTRYKKNASFAIKFLPQVFSHIILRYQKYQRKTTHVTLLPQKLQSWVLPKHDFEGYMKNSKKKFEENQNYIGDEEFHQEPDHPSTFMKMVKEWTRIISAINDGRCQLLPSKVIWDNLGWNHKPFWSIQKQCWRSLWTNWRWVLIYWSF